ncbi:MAG: hypothetical protein M1421_04950 [Candidatus Eremiobacteraeota bacterium]|jgi:phage I-like protein|nr:hypothetical protein [Candidatus Eremiobacteraeota bacterium]MCL5055659.1 hypothetical protein [Bacillota bacterium]
MKLHLRLKGNSQTLDLSELALNPDAEDQQIKESLKKMYQLDGNALKSLVVDRHPEGIVVRPSAVFG